MGDDQNIAERNENGLHQNETDRPAAWRTAPAPGSPIRFEDEDKVMSTKPIPSASTSHVLRS